MRGGDEELGAVASAHRLEVDRLAQNVAQRVEVERVELVRRELAAQDLTELLQGGDPGLEPRIVGAEQSAQRPVVKPVQR